MEAEVHYSGNTTTTPKIRKITNKLYNVKVEFEIPNCLMFGTTAIIDTGASACCINKKVILEDALEPLTKTIPLIYAFDMKDSNGIKMLIGANFLRSMKGGIQIEGDEITIYKKVTRIKTSNQTEVAEVAITELERRTPKAWKKNGELCKLDIINPDITIEDRPLKHVTPAMEDSFKKHVDTFLKISSIRPIKSRHKTMAMIVNSGTTIDPAIGREIKGKERMVFNYKSLNDNTYKDQYSLPGINMIIKRVGGAKIFLKFDLKSGFHQVAMDEESIPWTAFLVPGGLYEWLVMPFGLKNAPAVFQRKMDKCFKGTESFIAVYIDDILVFSKNEKNHAKHLEKMLKICEDNDLVLSLTKMKIAVSTIDFLGVVIGEGTIKMHRRNEVISSSGSLLSGGSSTIPQCLSKEYEDHLQRSHEDFQLLSRIFTKVIFTHEEPGALYRHYQLKANQTPVRMDKSNAWRSVTQDIELSAAKEAVKAIRSLQAIIQCKAKSASAYQPKTTTGLTKEKMSEFKTKKPEESLLN
ncbi:Orf y [Tanacetum coccineum]